MMCGSFPDAPDTADAPAPFSRWRSVLYERFQGNPYPLLVFSDCVIPAASLWTGARLWSQAFREAGLKPGERIALALAPSPAFLQVLIAALWEGLTIAPLPPVTGKALDDLITAVDARIAITNRAGEDAEESKSGDCPSAPDGVWFPDGVSGPDKQQGGGAGLTLRLARRKPSTDIRFLLRTSGTSSSKGSHGKWIALSDSNVWAHLDCHLSALGLGEESRVLSVLPWHHAFGLLIDLLPALLSGAEIICDPSGGRDIPGMIARAQEAEVTHLSAVPLTIARLAEHAEGMTLLRSLQGGVVGGAPVDFPLTGILCGTRLRVGYGQTEASPGIALGEPGCWSEPFYLGRAVPGCAVRLGRRGTLQFRGANASLGVWTEARGLRRLPPDRWSDTGDIVRLAESGDMFFRGRSDDSFKMANGRQICAGVLETELRDSFPCLAEVLLHTPDGRLLELFVTPRSGAALPPCAALLQSMGAPGRVTEVRVVPPDVWHHTPKGSLRRAATLNAITGTAASAD